MITTAKKKKIIFNRRREAGERKKKYAVWYKKVNIIKLYESKRKV